MTKTGKPDSYWHDIMTKYAQGKYHFTTGKKPGWKDTLEKINICPLHRQTRVWDIELRFPANAGIIRYVMINVIILPTLSSKYDQLLGVSLQIPSPHVPWSSSLSLPLEIPGQDLTGDAGCWFPQGVADPTPSSSSDLFFHWRMVVIAKLHWLCAGRVDLQDLCLLGVDVEANLGSKGG
ncbi:hypothetical protein QQF64_035940 [Cirrhinus molitorella]|uniref:Uncharacterized protein n=1 Tax=Cirrhinus molitorella TaxID=172907 RepID=A0ABR3NH59_9TELE